MYVVRRPFRNKGTRLLPGSIVEPGNIKWFKTRLKDRDIVEVNEHNFDTWRNYFAAKFHVELKEQPEQPEQPEQLEQPIVVKATAILK